ncbi:ubiquitin carboxyl-terminal hydrolase MINDY-2 isoform X2 [Patella vulgata]|uniref:ubiquitin carboxyl-terminal hydrolase MINDY-2 isoform X2 n=1 Tax=Patella vulgata TaxID=6465 RepID=UPI00217F4201|nr:ubiquitin carboxyl-terminal hydrolase MINDY-2 isoform X2 [Patella vulgata]
MDQETGSVVKKSPPHDSAVNVAENSENGEPHNSNIACNSTQVAPISSGNTQDTKASGSDTQSETLTDNSTCQVGNISASAIENKDEKLNDSSNLVLTDTNEETNQESDGQINIETAQSDTEIISAKQPKLDELSPDQAIPADLPSVKSVDESENEVKSDTASGGVESSKTEKSENGQNTYYIKWINFNNNQVPIITQNENGPCPLLAIVNVLLLKGSLKLPQMIEMITSEQLMTYLGDYIFENKPKNLSENIQANYEQNMQDGINIMCKLQTGLDVNVKFNGVDDFEYTPECIIFDLLEIPLYHGWLVDPQDSKCVEAIGKLSYNQVVEKIITQKSSDKEEDAREALVAEQFLERSASQLTYHGICELCHTVKDNQLCVFFRNNHFTTLFKHNQELFMLVTDQGFLTETNVVWETLSNVEGDCHFVDSNFRTYTKPEPSTHPIPPPNVEIGSEEQIDHDYLVALSLQQDPPLAESEATAWASYEKDSATIAQKDHEFAKRLQEEEDRRAAAEEAAHQQRAAPPSQPGPSQPSIPRRNRDRDREKQKDKDNCVIL